MSFVQREIDRIRAVLVAEPDAKDRDALYAAQQALVWALEPTGFMAPLKMMRRYLLDEAGQPDAPGSHEPAPATPPTP